MVGTYKTKSGSVAGTQSLPTPMPMSVIASTLAESNAAADFKFRANGIVPGYTGHIPRARDKYGGAAHGGIAREGQRGPPMARGPQKDHTRPEDVLPERFMDFIGKSSGVMPGYAGVRPEASHVNNVSAYGGVPHLGTGGHQASVGLNVNVMSTGAALEQAADLILPTSVPSDHRI